LVANYNNVIPRLDRGIQKTLDYPVNPDNSNCSKVSRFARKIAGKAVRSSVCCNQQGMALVITLLVLVLLTAMVVEFSYGVYTGTNNLYNWRDSQRLSLMAKSGVNVSTSFLNNVLSSGTAKPTQSFIEMPVENPFEDFQGTITVRIEDENAKFNINMVVNKDKNSLNDDAYNSFIQLLKILSQDEKIADRIVDWIDKNTETSSGLSDSEVNAKNAPLSSVNELLLIPGISKENYDTLLPYITVYGDGLININSAEKIVLRSLSKDINEEIAQRVVDYRNMKPFDRIDDLQNISGISLQVYGPISTRISTEGKSFSLCSVAASGGVKRIIDTVWKRDGNTIEYWKEY
jgi:general secretion pathway protein K